jgi:hypothetical protein
MAKKKAKKGARIKLVSRIAMIGVIIFSVGMITAMIIFVYRTMNTIADSSFSLSEVDEEGIETIDLKGIEELRARLDVKNALDEPRAGRPHNPFADISLRNKTAFPQDETVAEPEIEPEEDTEEEPEPDSIPEEQPEE